MPPAKPSTPFSRPELTRLPRLTAWRRIFRRLVNALCRLAVILFTRCQITGLKDFPWGGPALVVTNHLGDADPILAAALFPAQVEGLSKIDLVRDYPPIGWLMEAYGVIWVHRGQPDRRALRAAIQGLREGRMVALAPEGRESLTGSLEEGTGGAAFLALKTGALLVPVVFTGTENRRLFGNLKRLRRTPVSMTVGRPFSLRPDASQAKAGDNSASQASQSSPDDLPDRQAIQQGTQAIMFALAELLPPEYRGVYQKALE